MKSGVRRCKATVPLKKNSIKKETELLSWEVLFELAGEALRAGDRERAVELLQRSRDENYRRLSAAERAVVNA